MDRSFGWTRWLTFGAVFAASVAQGADKPANRLKLFDKSVKPATATPAAKVDAEKWATVVATVNGESITREQLAEELIATHGRRQLELLINRRIIEQACKDRKIEVTRVDIENDINDTLKKFNLKRSEFIERVLGSKEITFAQYVRDTVWPALALKKLVDGRSKVSDEDIAKSFEANYGPKVDVRMLVVMELRRAQELWEKVNEEKDPAKRLAVFEEMCKTYSIDQATRAFGGKTQPINKHTGYPEIENLAFSLKKGELSKVVQLPEGNLMLLCVDHIPARTDITLSTPLGANSKETVRDMLRKDIMEKKIRIEVAQLYKELYEKSAKNNFLSPDFDAEDLKAASFLKPDEPAAEGDAAPGGPAAKAPPGGPSNGAAPNGTPSAQPPGNPAPSPASEAPAPLDPSVQEAPAPQPQP